MVLAETTGTDAIRYLHGLDLVAQSDGVSIEYFAYDGLGSVRQVLDAAALPLMAQTFDPYGNPYSYTGPTESVARYGYTGEYQDSNGLVFLRARYYAPSMGRFVQMDPSRQEQNLYQYSLSNPVMLTDPSGLCSSGHCSDGSTANAPPISVNLNLTIPPELMALFCDCAAEQDVKDFFNGILDQLKLDMALQPYNMAINFIAHLQPPPGLGFEKYPLSAVSNLATNTRAEAERLNAKFWNGSGWYKTGRLVGRVISTGIALVLTFDGPLTIGIGITGEGLSIACEVASLGMCSAVAGGGVVVSTALVITGAAEMAYGAAVVWANAANPVGGGGTSDDGASSGIVEGRPEVPRGRTRIRRDVRRINSEEFKNFLRQQGISTKGWHYVMETWQTPSGKFIERHFWEGPGGEHIGTDRRMTNGR